MKVLPSRSFCRGFLVGLVLIGVIYLFNHWGAVGGQHAESPDGRYQVSVTTGLNPSAHEPYEICLREFPSGNTIYQVTFASSSDEVTEPLRGRDRVIRWSQDSSQADIQIGGKPVLRLFVP